MRNIFECCEEAYVCLRHGENSREPNQLSRPPKLFENHEIKIPNDHQDTGSPAPPRRRRESSQSSGNTNSDTNLLDPAEVVFNFIRDLANSEHMKNGKPAWAELSDTPNIYELSEGLRQLSRLSWWTRMWTVQEIVVPKRVAMLYGSAIAPWEMFASAAASYVSHSSSCCSKFIPEFLSDHSKVLSRFCIMVSDIENMRRQWNLGIETSFLQLLSKFRV